MIASDPPSLALRPLQDARHAERTHPDAASPVAAGALQRIREGTGAMHRALDAALPNGIGDRDALLRYLHAMRGLSRWLSRTPVASLAPWQAAWRDPARDALLREDLQALGARARVQPLPPPLDPREWVGGSYVIEGSALGGRLLLRQALSAAERDPGISSALRFLRHHTREPSRWRRFVAALQATPAADIPHAVEGARRGFALTQHLLSAPENQNG